MRSRSGNSSKSFAQKRVAQPTWATASALTYKYPAVKNIEINQEMGNLDGVLDDVVELFQGAPNWGNPCMMCNVIPQSNPAVIIASMLSQV